MLTSKCAISSEREGLRTSNLVQTYKDGVRGLVSPTSDITSKVEDQDRKVTWCVWQVLVHTSTMKCPRNTKISRTVTHPTGNNAHRFHGQRLRSPDRLMLRPGVHHILRTERPTNFKLGTQLEHEEMHHGQRHYLKSQWSWWQGYVVRLTGVGP